MENYQKEILKKQIKWLDVLVIITFIFILGTRIFTLAYVSHISQATNSQITDVVELFEANPFAKVFFSIAAVKGILLSLIIPAAATALYILFRNRVLQGKIDLESLRYYVNFFFFVLLLNFLNDMTIYLAKLF